MSVSKLVEVVGRNRTGIITVLGQMPTSVTGMGETAMTNSIKRAYHRNAATPDFRKEGD